MNLSTYISLYGTNKQLARSLVTKSNELHIPAKYVEALQWNVNSGLIPSTTLEKISDETGVSLIQLGIDSHEIVSNFELWDEEELDFEDILRNIKDE